MKPYLAGFCLFWSLYPGEISSQPTEPPVRLSIRPEGNRKVIVSWTNSSAGLELERPGFLSGSSSWRPVEQTPIVAWGPDEVVG